MPGYAGSCDAASSRQCQQLFLDIPILPEGLVMYRSASGCHWWR